MSIVPVHDSEVPSDSQYWTARCIEATVVGPTGTTTIVTDRPFLRIGSHENADVRLDDSRIPACIAYIHATQQGLYCVPLNRSMRRVTIHPGWQGPNDVLTIGNYRIAVRRSQPTDCVPADGPELIEKGSLVGPSPVITIALPNSTAPLRHLRRQLTVIGRDQPSHLRISYEYISRCHCAMYWDGRSLWLIDLLSANEIRYQGEVVDWLRLPLGKSAYLQDLKIRFFQLEEEEISPPDGSPHDSASLESALIHDTQTPSAVSDTALTGLDSSPIPIPEVKDPPQEVVAMRAENQRLEQQVAELLAESENLSARISQHEQSWNEERSTWELQRDELEQAVASRSAEAERLEREREALQSQLDAQQRELAELQSQADQLKSSWTDEKQQLDRLLASQQDELSDLRSSSKSLQDDKHNLSQRVQQMLQEQAEITEQLQSLQQQQTAARDGQQEQEQVRQSTELQRLAAAYDKLLAEWDDRDRQIEAWRAQTTRDQSHLAAVKRQIEEQLACQTQATRDLQFEKDVLGKKNRELSKLVQQLQQDRRSLDEQRQTLLQPDAAPAADWDSQRCQLEDALRQKSADLQRLSTERDSLMANANARDHFAQHQSAWAEEKELLEQRLARQTKNTGDLQLEKNPLFQDNQQIFQNNRELGDRAEQLQQESTRLAEQLHTIRQQQLDQAVEWESARQKLEAASQQQSAELQRLTAERDELQAKYDADDRQTDGQRAQWDQQQSEWVSIQRQLEEQLAYQTQKTSDFQFTNDEFCQDNAKLAGDLQQLQDETAKQQEEQARLADELQTVRQQHARQAADWETQRHELEVNLRQKSTELQHIECQLDALRNEKNKRESQERAPTSQERSAWAEEKLQLEQQLSRHIRELTQMWPERERLLLNARELSHRVDGLQEERRQLAGQLQDVQHRLLENDKQRDQNDRDQQDRIKELQRLQQENLTLQAQVETSSSRLHELETQTGQQQSTLALATSQLKSDLDSRDSEIVDLKSANQEFERQLSESKTAADASASRLREHQQQLDQLRAKLDLDNRSSEISALKSANQELELQLSESRSAAEAMAAQISEHHQRWNELRGEREQERTQWEKRWQSVSTQLNEVRTEKEALQAELDLPRQQTEAQSILGHRSQTSAHQKQEELPQKPTLEDQQQASSELPMDAKTQRTDDAFTEYGPPANEEAVTSPESTEPSSTESELAEPELTDPELTDPELTDPELTEPELTEPDLAEPDAPSLADTMVNMPTPSPDVDPSTALLERLMTLSDNTDKFAKYRRMWPVALGIVALATIGLLGLILLSK